MKHIPIYVITKTRYIRERTLKNYNYYDTGTCSEARYKRHNLAATDTKNSEIIAVNMELYENLMAGYKLIPTVLCVCARRRYTRNK